MKPRRNAQYCHTSLLLLSIFSILTFVSSPRAEIIDTVLLTYDKLYIRHLTDEGISQLDYPLTGQADWTQFGGNAQHPGCNPRDSLAPPLSLRWSRKFCDYPLWTPIIFGSKLVVTPFDANAWTSGPDIIRPRVTLWCVDTESGSSLWTGDFGGCDYNSQPTYDDTLVYLYYSYPYHRVAALDARSGEMRWITPLYIQWIKPLAPVPYRGRIFVAGNYYGGMHCLDAKVGGWLWRIRLADDDRWASAAYGDYLYTFNLHRLFVNDPATGDTLVIRDTLDALAPIPRSRPELRLQYNNAGQNAAPILDTTNMRLYCKFYYWIYVFDVSTPTDPRPLWRIEDSTSLRSAAAHYDTLLVHVCRDTLKVRSTTTGEVLWTFVPDNPFHNLYPPVIANGYIYCSTPPGLMYNADYPPATYIIDIHTRECIQELPVGGYLAVANGQLYIASRNGTLHCYGESPVSADDPLDPNASLPVNFILHQNYPNPFNPTTEISFTLPRAEHVRLDILNPLGQTVTTLLDTRLSPGTHSVTWHTTDSHGNPLATGAYFYRLTAGDHTATRKMLLLK